MLEELLPRVLPFALLGLYVLYLSRRTEARIRAMTDRWVADCEARHQAEMRNLQRQLAEFEDQAAARRAAWEAEQAALDAEAAESAR